MNVDLKDDFDLRLLYDARGDRVFKRVISFGNPIWTSDFTYYSREAGGKLLATYVNRTEAALVNPGGDDQYLIPVCTTSVSGHTSGVGIGSCIMTKGLYQNGLSSAGGEWYIYGYEQHGLFARAHPYVSGNGSLEYNTTLSSINYFSPPFNRYVRLKEYDLKDHLDNVRATHSDLKLRTATAGVFDLDLLSASNYFPFGMQMPARCWVNSGAGSEFWGRFGFNGKEKDDELKGKGNSYDYGARHYDPRLARFMSLDLMRMNFPWYSPFLYGGDNPIYLVDRDGNKPSAYNRPSDSWRRPNNTFIDLPENRNIAPPPFTRVYTIPNTNLIYTEGRWNPIKTNQFSSKSEIGCMTIKLFDNVTKMGFTGFKKVVADGKSYYTPLGKEGNQLDQQEMKYQQKKNEYLNEAIDDLNKEGIDPKKADPKLIKATTGLAEVDFKMKNGPSPYEQFDAWAKEQEKNGNAELGGKEYKPEIRQAPSNEPE